MSKAKENAKRVVILMAVGGFIFSSAALTILALVESNNPDSAAQQQADLLKQIQEQQKEAAPKEALPGHSAAPFDAASVTELKVETLTEGDGPAATAESTVSANYFGWTSDGKIFDSSSAGGVAAPVDFPLSGVIKGWTQGLTGVKQGSTVKLLIPAEMAYGATDNGDGRPFGPLAFIIELKSVK